MPSQLLTLREAVARTRLSKTELYRRINAGTFCKPIRLGPQRIAFVESEVEAWIAAQISARDERGKSAEQLARPPSRS